MALLFRAFVGGTVALGTAAVAVAAVRSASVSLAVVALLCAAAIVAEYFQSESGDGLDGEGAHTFSFSSGVHLAAAVVAGPFAAAVAAAVGIVMALETGTKAWPLIRASALADASSDLAEAGIGGAFAFFALANPWAIVLLAPLAFTAYQAHARLGQLRRETAQAL